MERKSFLDQEPPPGYIAGIGRGATGFTTRADVGGSRLPPTERSTESDDEGNFQDADEVNDGGLLGKKPTNKDKDKDDDEADEIFKQVEDRMKLRNIKRRRLGLDDNDNNKEDEDTQGEESNVSKISSQFVDLKQGLSAISVEEWTNLPEVGDLTKRNKRQRKLEQDNRRTYTAPDTLISGMGSNGGTDSSIDISALTNERQKLFKSQLDANFYDDNDKDNNDEPQVNTEAYLSEIRTLQPSQNPEEIQKLRTVLTQYTKSDPSKAEGWIARARLEETSQNYELARKIISQGCSNCSRDESIWLEAARLNEVVDLKMAKVIIADGVRKNVKAVKLWIKATDLERDQNDKKRIIRTALENIPNSSKLWKLLIELEIEKEEKVKIASRATELVKNDTDLWLTLIGLQSYEDAKISLNKARKAIPNEVKIWLRAVQLEFQHSADLEKLSKLVKKTFKECSLSRDQWFEQAMAFEKNKGLIPITEAIVRELLSQDQEEGPSYASLTTESTKYISSVHVYKTILNEIVVRFPKKAAPWRNLIALYKSHFPLQDLFMLFETIIKNFPKNSTFRLMYSKEVWKSANDITKAKEILARALKTLSSSTDIWLALIKLESLQEGNPGKVEELFQEARTKVNNERIWYKYITHLRQQSSSLDIVLQTIDTALSEFDKCFKLYLQKSQILTEQGKLPQAREVLSIATKLIPQSIPLWINLSQIDFQLGNKIKARSDLELALLKNPNNETVLLSQLQLEVQLNTAPQQINQILSRVLKQHSHSPLLWSFKLRINTNKSLRKTLYTDALAATENHHRVLIEIGRNFFGDGKWDKAQRWFERALEADEMHGDSYAWVYLSLKKQGKDTGELVKKINDVEPNRGDVWVTVAKKIENLNLEHGAILEKVAELITK